MVIYLINTFSNFSVIIQALLAGLFSFLFTSLGASLVFLFKKMNKTIMNGLLAISSGIMLSAAFFSLINPAIELLKDLYKYSWLIIPISFLCGCLFILFNNLFINTLYKNNNNLSKYKRCIMLFISITLHNIPEGLVIGVAFAAAKAGNNTLFSAMIITLGIAIQNFPEGAAISLPLRGENISRFKSFLFGMLSGLVEPLASVIGVFLVLKINNFMPFIMLFSAGAMFYVIVMEIIPESQNTKKEDLMTLLNALGFLFMMVLEVIFS